MTDLGLPSPEPRAAPLVLVADNDVGVNALLQEVLTRAGLRTASVTDGAAALRFVQETPVALLVCDLDMPLMDGREVMQHLEAMAAPPPVLIVSGYLEAELERRLVDSAIVRGVFRKPFDVGKFAASARAIAGTSAELSG